MNGWRDEDRRQVARLNIEQLRRHLAGTHCVVCNAELNQGAGEHRTSFSKDGAWCNCRSRLTTLEGKP